MARRVVIEHLLERLAFGTHAQRMRTRPYKRHGALQNRKQLGQLVDAEPADDASNPRNPGVSPACLTRAVGIRLVGKHRSEFQDLEMSAVEPLACLTKEHRPSASSLMATAVSNKNGDTT